MPETSQRLAVSFAQRMPAVEGSVNCANGARELGSGGKSICALHYISSARKRRTAERLDCRARIPENELQMVKRRGLLDAAPTVASN